MKASLVHVRDPLRPQINRDVHRIARRSRIDTLLRRQGLIVGRGRSMRRLANFVVTVDGGKNYLLADQWARQVEDGQVVSVINVPAGGSALRALAMIAVAFVAPYAAAAMLGTTMGALGLVGSLLSTGLMLGGSMLVNAMLPLPKPPTGSTSSQSANYGISARGNTAKLLQSIPVLYGRFNITPDYAAQPYTEFNGTDQTLFALSAITQGDRVVEQINIGDTRQREYRPE